ncbi:MAG: cysteine hydrolase [Rhodobacteraceae bacterium]|nr:cysteine hydrolase [Paracoccaceae bacterium]
MHPTDLPADIREKLITRRGRLHVFDRLESARTALVVIDMQGLFCAEGALLEIPVAREIVPAITRMADALRGMGGTVAWVRSAFPTGARDWRVFFEHLNAGPMAAGVRTGLRPGLPDYELFGDLRASPGDIEVDKDRFSAFFPGASPLPDLLRARGIDTLLIAGTLTNVCCESSARDAMMDNFRVVMLSDANATRSDFEHMSALVTFAMSFGDVQTVDEAIGFLQEGQVARAAE